MPGWQIIMEKIMKAKAQLMLAVVYIAGLAAPVNQFKVPPAMKQLTADLGFNLGNSGWLMSVFAFVGLILAIPAGRMLRRFSNKTVSIAALGMLLTGSLIGTISMNISLMLFSRALEGMGMCIFSVCAPASIAAWFPPEKRGTATGIWVTWVPVGSMIMYAVAPLFVSATQWRPIWWFAFVYTAFAFILFCLFFKMPAAVSSSENYVREHISRDALRNICLIAATFSLLNVVTIATKSYLPVFLEQEKNYTPAGASGIINIMIIVSVIMGPVTGYLSDKTGSRKMPLMSGAMLALAVSFILFSATGIPVVIALFALGISCGNIAATSFVAAAELCGDVRKAGIGLSIVALGQYLGMSVGPVLFSSVAYAFNWHAASMVLSLAAGLAVLCALSVNISGHNNVVRQALS